MNRKRKYSDDEDKTELWNYKMVEWKYFKNMISSRDPACVIRDMIKKLLSLEFTLEDIEEFCSELLDGMFDRINRFKTFEETKECHRDMRRIIDLQQTLSRAKRMKCITVFELVAERFPENITRQLTIMIEKAKEEKGTSGIFAEALGQWVEQDDLEI